MLPAASVLANNILALPTTLDATEGLTNLVNAIADFMDQVQAGSLGSVGIFALDRAAMIAIILTSTPVINDSWISIFANALEAGINTATITPATVTNPIWIGSGTKDIATSGTGSGAITTISAAKATFTSGLHSATADNNPPVPMAQAVSDATLQFVFTCIGLGPPPTLSPIPVPTNAE